MALLTVAQLKQHYSSHRVEELATPQGGSYDSDIVTEIIATEEGLVKNALSERYTSTELGADAGVRRIVAVLTMRALELRRGDVTSGVQGEYAVVMTALERLRLGETKLAAFDRVLPKALETFENTFEQEGYFDGLHDEDTD